MLLPILLLAWQAAPASPPPMTATHSSPPAIVAVDMPGRATIYAVPEANEVPADRIEIRVLGGTELLWDAPLRVGRAGASVTQHVAQAEPPACFVKGAADRWVQGSLSMSFSRRKLSNTPTGTFTYDVRVSWTRAAASDGCAREGMRTVQVQSVAELAPGQEAVLRGDAGLEVRLKRR